MNKEHLYEVTVKFRLETSDHPQEVFNQVRNKLSKEPSFKESLHSINVEEVS